MTYERRNTITSLHGHHYDTRGIVREGANPVAHLVNSGPLPDALNLVKGRTPYVSIDIETTGIDYDYCQILEFGAVIDDWVTPLDKLPRFHAYLIHDRIQGEPFALAMNAEILRRIANRNKPECADYTFIEPSKLAGMFQFWANSYDVFCAGHSGKSLVPSGKNFAGFDRPFLKRLPEWSERVNVLHRCIDPAMLYWDRTKDVEPPSTKQCYERAGIKEEVAHNAVEDAIGIIRLIRASENAGDITIGDINIAVNDESDPKGLGRRLMSELRRRGHRLV